MRKLVITLCIATFAHFGVKAQSGEVFVKLNQLDGYRAKFTSDQLQDERRIKGAVDYAIGYNYFLKNNSYVGIGLAYIPVTSMITSINTNSTRENKTVTTTESTRYRLGLHVGKRNEYKKFIFYSEMGAYAILYRDFQITRDITNTDPNGVVFYSVNEVENWTNNDNEFGLYLSQGIYYNPFCGFSFGIDIGVHGVVGRKKGTDEKYRKTTQSGATTEVTTTTEHDNTVYNIRLLPSIGIRYTFNKVATQK